ncbi:helix-turn-helix domain-containing protein [Paenibacillus macerans]|uniref:AraC family transcriptional regulator n=1 Tax=Paenibacillus macerans TaxID=44252 RepID=UPI003D314CC5
MNKNSNDHLYEIFPEIFNVVDRNATPSWRLDNVVNSHNLMLIYDGRVQFAHDHVQFRASRGDLVYYKPGVLRKAHTFPEHLMKCFAVDFQYTCPVLIDDHWKLMKANLPFSYIQKIEDEFLFSKLLDLFSQLTKSALSGKHHNKTKQRAIFTEILTLLFQYKEGNQYNYSNMRKVQKIIHYMTQHYANGITLQELADYAQISPSYMGSIFKKVTGKSTIDYLIEIRINKAKSLLKDGLSVSETAKLVGFNDIYYFSRTFKKHEGLSPTQYADISRSEF